MVSDVDGTFGGSCDCNGAVPPLGALPVAPPDSLGSYAEQLAVLGPNTLSALKYQPWDVNTTMEIVVNGRAFAGCVSPAHFTVLAKTVSWTSTVVSIVPGDEVVARYRYVTEPMTNSQIVAATLYYVGVTGQTNFSLSVPDRYGATWTLSPGQPVNVTRNGARLVPDLGAGDGGYKIVGNVIVLLWPTGKGETVIVDVYVAVGAPILPPSPPLIVNDAIITTTLYYHAGRRADGFFAVDPRYFRRRRTDLDQCRAGVPQRQPAGAHRRLHYRRQHEYDHFFLPSGAGRRRRLRHRDAVAPAPAVGDGGHDGKLDHRRGDRGGRRAAATDLRS